MGLSPTLAKTDPVWWSREGRTSTACSGQAADASREASTSVGNTVGTVEYRIHPSVGVARMGASSTHFYLGPEEPHQPRQPRLHALSDLRPVEPDADDEGSFRDPSGRIAKQAARFRVFEYRWEDTPDGQELEGVREVTPDVAELRWSVEVANRKGGTAAHNEPGAHAADTRDHDDGATIAMIDGERLQLGSVALEPDTGRLLVIGSDGERRPPSADTDHVPDWLEHNPELDPDDAAALGRRLTHLVNAGWEDDAADGRVSVEVFPDGHDGEEGIAALSAWVVIAPPDYGGDAEHLVRLYDVALDRAVTADRWLVHGERRLSAEPDATRQDVRRQLRAVLDLPWVSDYEVPFLLTGDPDPEPHEDDAEGLLTTMRVLRGQLLHTLRPPLRTFGGPHRWYVAPDQEIDDQLRQLRLRPTEDGADGHTLPHARWLTLPRLAHSWLTAWGDGDKLVDDPFVGELARPKQLDEAHLGSLSGGPFLPGVEVGLEASRLTRWVARPGAHEGHVDVRFVGEPGELTYDLAVPWQVTFQRDQERWWPTSRPVTVVPDGTATAVPFDRDEATGGRLDLLDQWQELGVVRRRPDGALRESERRDPAEAARPPWAVGEPLGEEQIRAAMSFYESTTRSSDLRGLASDDVDVVRRLLGVGPRDLERAEGTMTVSEVFAQRVASFQRVQLTETTIDGMLGEGTLSRMGRDRDADEPPPGWNAAGLVRGMPDPALEEYTAGTSFPAVLLELLRADGRLRTTDIRERNGVAVVGLHDLLPALELTPAMLVRRLMLEEESAPFAEVLGAGFGDTDAVVDQLGLSGADVSLSTLIATADVTALCRLLAHPAVTAAQLRWYERELVDVVHLARHLTETPDDMSVAPSFGAVTLVAALGYDVGQSPTAGTSAASARAAQVEHATNRVAAATDDDDVVDVAEVLLRRWFDDAKPPPVWRDVWTELLPDTEPSPEPATVTRVVRLRSTLAAVWDDPVDLDIDVREQLGAAVDTGSFPPLAADDDFRRRSQGSWVIHASVFDERPVERLGATWDDVLAAMSEFDFLGARVIGHPAFLERLRQAATHLHTTLSPSDVPTAAVGGRSTWRPDERTTSYHVFGLAVDIRGGMNPWIAAPGVRNRNAWDHWILWRAAWLHGAEPISPVSSHALAREHPPGGDSTPIWNHFAAADEALRGYVDPDADLAGLIRGLKDRAIPPFPADRAGPYPYRAGGVSGTDPGTDAEAVLAAVQRLVPDDEVSDADLATWQGLRDHDIEVMRSRRPNGGGLNANHRLMDLPLELVRALRDHASLGWGACDFGTAQNGDTMHFDLRSVGDVNGMVGRVSTVLASRRRSAEAATAVPAGMVCLTTALAHWELGAAFGIPVTYAVPVGGPSPRVEHVDMIEVPADTLDVGRASVSFPDYELAFDITDRERTVADAFLHPDVVSPEQAEEALRRYRRDTTDLARLRDVAERIGAWEALSEAL